jgi:cytochrome c-type biogenesis protein CcmH/NrfG
MPQKKKRENNQLTFTHLIVTALAMLVVGYLFGRFSVGVPGITGAAAPPAIPASGLPDGASIAALRQAAADSPDSASVWIALGNAYFDSSRYADAIDAYTRSLEIDGSDPNVWTDRGIMYRRIGDPTQAIKDFGTAAALDPTHRLSRFNRGIVQYYDLNSVELARAAFEEVLALDSDFVTPAGAYLKDFMETLR